MDPTIRGQRPVVCFVSANSGGVCPFPLGVTVSAGCHLPTVSSRWRGGGAPQLECACTSDASFGKSMSNVRSKSDLLNGRESEHVTAIHWSDSERSVK